MSPWKTSKYVSYETMTPATIKKQGRYKMRFQGYPCLAIPANMVNDGVTTK